MPNSSLIVIADTNVLINFLRIDRIDLIANHSHQFVITEHVKEEVTGHYAIQYRRLQRAIEDGIVTERIVSALDELRLFGTLMKEGRIGSGECSAIACAVCGNYKLAIDDKRAVKVAQKVSPDLTIWGTQELIISMISEQLLDIYEADKIKDIWASEHRFRMKISSFRDILNSS